MKSRLRYLISFEKIQILAEVFPSLISKRNFTNSFMKKKRNLKVNESICTHYRNIDQTGIAKIINKKASRRTTSKGTTTSES